MRYFKLCMAIKIGLVLSLGRFVQLIQDCCKIFENYAKILGSRKSCLSFREI